MPLLNSADMTVKKADRPTLPLHGEDELARSSGGLTAFTLMRLSFTYPLPSDCCSIYLHCWLFNGREVFDEVTLYLLVLGVITVPFNFITGIIG